MLMMRSKGIAVIYRLREGKERPLLTKGKRASAEVPLYLSQCPDSGRTRVCSGSKHQSALVTLSSPQLETFGKWLFTLYLNCFRDEFPGLCSHNQHTAEQMASFAGQLFRSQTKGSLGGGRALSLLGSK